MVTTEDIKKLREETGVSVMQCKKALEESGGDAAKALIILRKQASASAEKKASRELNAGTIASYIHGDGVVGVILELSCETDFVSKNEDFKKLAYELAMHVAAANPKYLSREGVGEEEIVKAKEVFAKEAEDKPAEMQEKIISGKLDAFLKELILLEQNYIKDDSKKVSDLISEAVQKFGERTEIRRFVRFSVKE